MADSYSSDAVSSILWLEGNDHRTDQVADAWAVDHDPLRLAVTTLDQFVGECYESEAGPRSLLDALTRRRLVAEALRDLDEYDILDDAHRHRGEVMDLFSALEDEGHDSPEAIQAVIADSTLPTNVGTILEQSYTRFTENRERTTTPGEYTQSDAYRAVCEGYDPFVALENDVIVLSGYYDLSANKRAVIDGLAERLDLVILLPTVDTPDQHVGANAAVTDAMTFYQDLADETHHVRPESPSPLAEAAGNLYTPSTSAGLDSSSETLRWVEAPTPDREVRQVARSLRKRLATDDIDPDDVLVVVPGLISYREHVADVFPANGVEPVTFVTELLYQMYAGDAMLALVSICEDEPTADLLARLVTNPVVTLHDVDASGVADLARRLPTDDYEPLLDELGDESRAALETLLEEADRVAATDGVESVDALRSLFDHVDLEDNVNEIDTNHADFDAEMESRAFRRVDRALDAIERTAGTLDLDDVIGRISDELDQIRVPPPQNATEGLVEVVGPRDAYMQSYDHLYLVGFTAADFPPNPERPRFFEELEAGLPGIETADDRGTARYRFATMLGSAESVYITTPEMTSDDDPRLPSAVLDELSRVTGLEPTDHELGNGCREDVQRAIGRDRTGRSPAKAIEQAIDAGVFADERATRVRTRAECAQNRTTAQRTDHDALLNPDTVDTLHPPEEREPYSPTQVTQYATCGFRYYMDRVLEIEAPEEYTLEPDPLDLGRLVHDILEVFYTGLQTAPGERVDLREYARAELEAHLLDAGERVLDELDLPYEDTFYERWLTALFAGLGNPGENEYYHADLGTVHEAADGLFTRFLDAELDREAHPGWFEVGMDLTDDENAVFDLELPDGRTVPLGGRIDRITVDETDDPVTGIVHDYKSSSRSPLETVDGVSFQLPMYALAAGRQLREDGVSTPLDAAFYVLNPPDEVSEKWTLRYYLKRYSDATDEDYRRLVEEITPRRIGDVVAGIDGGAFQPTVLDEDTAGCRHCEYSNVCDVRYHRRREVATAMAEDELPGYVPQYAREDSLLDLFGGDDD